MLLVSGNLMSQANKYLKAKIAFEEGLFLAAETNINAYQSQFPDDKKAILLSAEIHLGLKKFPKVVEELSKLKESFHQDILLMTARSNAGMGKHQLAMAQLREYLAAVKKQPENLIKKIPEFENLKKTASWEKLWEKEQYSKKELLLINAMYAINSGKEAEAIDRLDEILKRYKRTDEAYFLKSKLLFERGDYSNAFSLVEKAVVIDDKVLEYQNLKAKCYARLGKEKKAMDGFQQVLSSDSLYLPAYQGRAEAFMNSTDYEEALKDIRYYLSYYPNDKQARFLNAEINSKSGDFLSAISTYGKLIKEDPSNSDYFIGRANSYMSTKTYKYAIKDYSMALDLDPKNIAIYKKKALAHKLAGEMNKACNEWSHAAKLGDIESLDNLKKYCK